MSGSELIISIPMRRVSSGIVSAYFSSLSLSVNCIVKLAGLTSSSLLIRSIYWIECVLCLSPSLRGDPIAETSWSESDRSYNSSLLIFWLRGTTGLILSITTLIFGTGGVIFSLLPARSESNFACSKSLVGFTRTFLSCSFIVGCWFWSSVSFYCYSIWVGEFCLIRLYSSSSSGFYCFILLI